MADQRVLVMNGRRLLETAGDDAKWKVEKTEVAPSGMKPGIYNIGNAKSAGKDQVSEGMVIHADSNAVYQQVGKGKFVKHEAAAFEKVPVWRVSSYPLQRQQGSGGGGNTISQSVALSST